MTLTCSGDTAQMSLCRGHRDLVYRATHVHWKFRRFYWCRSNISLVPLWSDGL